MEAMGAAGARSACSVQAQCATRACAACVTHAAAQRAAQVTVNHGLHDMQVLLLLVVAWGA